MKLSTFLKPLGESERLALAHRAKTTLLHLRNVAFSGKPCGPKLAVALEPATGFQVRRWDVRPDDWHEYWPELIGTEGAPAVPAATTYQRGEEARDAA